jgi:1,2-diacylglycerol 3-beta-glucosyltransferase
MAPAILLLSTAEGALLGTALIPWLLWMGGAGYLLTLTLGAALMRLSPRPQPARTRRFCILIPAHNEELLIGTVLGRVRELEYPPDAYEVVVIADNCTDKTAEVARANKAEVLERVDPQRRGKGYALDWAFNVLLYAPHAFDAFILLDADSVLSPNFLTVMNAALEQGHLVVQARYDVLNAQESWRTRLMSCALALAHYVKPLGRNYFGLSDGLKGNGMCFARKVLERVPWSGESITEDIEYTLRLVQAGIRVEFAPEAVVWAQMPTTGRQAATQRQRWEGGRYALFGKAIRLLAEGIRARSRMVVDRAVELLIPPFVEFLALPGICVAVAVVWLWMKPESMAARLFLGGWVMVLVLQLLYLSAGMVIARVPLSVASSLLFAPWYVLWKFCVYGAMLMRRGVGGWIRTERQALGTDGTGDAP